MAVAKKAVIEARKVDRPVAFIETQAAWGPRQRQRVAKIWSPSTSDCICAHVLTWIPILELPPCRVSRRPQPTPLSYVNPNRVEYRMLEDRARIR